MTKAKVAKLLLTCGSHFRFFSLNLQWHKHLINKFQKHYEKLSAELKDAVIELRFEFQM